MAVKVRNSDITGSDSVDRLGRILLGLESTLSELYTTLGCIYGLTTAQQESENDHFRSDKLVSTVILSSCRGAIGV
eukprot:SAG31_NODE_941_length_10868_cov_9.232241_7_plen_76_part_00